jgi:hypothetical protein
MAGDRRDGKASCQSTPRSKQKGLESKAGV